MSLFNSVDRNDLRYAYHAEPEFTYLNFSGRPELQRVRDLIDGWYEQYPDGDKPQLRSSFRSRNNLQHLSAYFELFLHQSLLRKGYQITVHPDLSHTSRRPDFLIEHPDGFSGFMEAVIASEDSNEQAAEKARASRIYDVLNDDVRSPDFWISVEVEGVLGRDFRERQVIRPTQQWINELSYDDAIRLGTDTDDPVFSSRKIQLGDASVKLEAIPKKNRDDPTARPVGMIIGGAENIHPVGAIQGALKKKSGRYGQLDRPYIIAVNVLSQGFEDDIAEDALFGTLVNPEKRMPDGSWWGPKGPQNTRVSGVLVVDNLKPSRLASATWIQYHNPWGQYPLGNHIQDVTSQRVYDKRLVSYEGTMPRQIFGLTKNWPQ